MNSTCFLITGFLVLLGSAVPRKYFLLPYIVAACFIPADQRIIIAGLDFTPLRILVISGFLRILAKGERSAFKCTLFDKLVFAWTICSGIIIMIQWHSIRALIYQSGVLFDVIGLYWLFRLNIESWSDVQRVTTVFATCALILAVFVAKEWATGNNPFQHLGVVYTAVREGRYRCQAAFPHSIVMGLFWATLAPMYVALAKSGRGNKVLCWGALGATVFMVFSTASSTPLVSLVAAIFFIPLFKYRRYGRQVVWGILFSLCVLHIVMEAPVWHMISRLDLVGGSTGYHRYKLIDEAITHFTEWALIGTRSTAHWGWGQDDITNQYIAEGVKGGLLGLILFVAVLVLAVKSIGRYSLLALSHKDQWLAWGLCVAVLAHCISFFGVTYFGQIRMLLFLMFAMSGWVYETLASKEFALISARSINARRVRDGCVCSHS